MMKSPIVILSLASLATAQSAACTADDCVRAVIGTRCRLEASSIQKIRTVDCSAFMSTTVTPATPTITTTITSTVYSIIGANVKINATSISKRAESNGREEYKMAANIGNLNYILLPPTAARALAPRQVTAVPSMTIPSYATACTGSSAYSSACSCAGITALTAFAPTPAAVTSTVLSGSGTIIPVCDPSANFGFQHIGGTIAPGIGLAVSTRAATSDSDCCASCFAPGSKCFVYEHFEGNCITVSESSGGNTPTDTCPFGVFGIGGVNNGTFYGKGPCATFT